MGGSIQLLTVRGISIRMHLTFPLILIWAMLQFGAFSGLGWSGALFGALATLLLFAIVVLHELGHSVAAQHYGVPVNEIVLLPIGGVAQLKYIPEKPIQEFVIAIAGPAVNIVLAVILYVLNRVFGVGGTLQDPTTMIFGFGQLNVDSMFNYIFTVNLFLAGFNLIPAFPMDGGRVLRALLASRMEYGRATAVAVSIGQSLAWLIGLWGFLNGGFFLILIAIFIYMGAGYEGQSVELRRVLGKLTVRQAYSRQAQTLAPNASLRDAIDRTLQSLQADFPICDGERLVGLLTNKQLVQALDRHPPETPVSAIMATDVQPAAPGDSLFDVQQLMTEQQLDAVPVVEGGRFVGLLTLRDVGEVFRIASTRPDLLTETART